MNRLTARFATVVDPIAVRLGLVVDDRIGCHRLGYRRPWWEARMWWWRHCYAVRFVPPVAWLVATHHEHRRVVREQHYVPPALDTRQDVVDHLARLQAAYRRVRELAKAPACAE